MLIFLNVMNRTSVTDLISNLRENSNYATHFIEGVEPGCDWPHPAGPTDHYRNHN